MGNQTFPRGCTPRESLIFLWTTQGRKFPDNFFGFSTVCPRPQMDPALNNWAICLGLGSPHWKHHCVYMRLASRWHDSLVCPVVSGVTRKAVATELHLTDITRKVVATEFNQHE